MKLALNEEEPESPGLADKFFGTSILTNILTIVIAISLFIFVLILLYCCKFVIMPICPGCCKTMIKKIERKLFWNSLLRACLEMYLGMGILFFY